MKNIAKGARVVYTQPSEGFWDIPGVIYRGQVGIYRLFEQMTPVMNQEQLAELYEIEKQKGNPHPADAPLIWAIITKSYELRNKNPQVAGKLRQFLKTGFRKYPSTLTEIIYNPLGEDKIIHNCKTSEQYSMNGKVIGPNDLIDILPNANVLEQILGTKNVTQINKVSNWINKTNSHIWRLNSKPSQKIEKVVRFGADDGRFSLCCDWDPLGEFPAFRVLKVD